MHDKNNAIVQCGAIWVNDEVAPIYCNTNTGECFFPDPTMSDDRLISELSVEEPSYCDLSDAVADYEAGVYGYYMGIIHEADTLIKILDDYTAIRAPADTPNADTMETFSINIYGDYDSLDGDDNGDGDL